MPKLSLKAVQMPSSPIRKLIPYAEQAKKDGKKVIHLNIGQPDILTPDSAKEAVRNAQIDTLEYSHSAGFLSYREGLTKYYLQHNIEVSPEDIMVTVGGSEALSFGFTVGLNTGDEVIIPEPFYANYNGFSAFSGVNIVPVTATIENNFALPSIEEFEEKISPRTKAILICNPSNPTGYLYTKEELEKLSKLVQKHDLFLFADEVYREFCYDGAQPYSVLNLKGIEENVIMIDSVSKRYSMCGARIGALVSKNKGFMKAAIKFAQARLSPPTYAQIAAEGALQTPSSYFEDVIDQYVIRRNIMVEGLNNIKGVYCPMPKGAFYCVARLPVEDTEDFCKWILEDFEYKGNTIMLAPLSGFYATPGLGKDEIRIAYVLKKEELELALTCLEKALEEYPHTIYS